MTESPKMLQLIKDPCAVLCLVAQSGPTLCDPMDCSPPGSSVHADSPGKYALEWVGMPSCIWSSMVSLIAGQILYCLSHQGSPRILEWVAYFFSRGSS